MLIYDGIHQNVEGCRTRHHQIIMGYFLPITLCSPQMGRLVCVKIHSYSAFSFHHIHDPVHVQTYGTKCGGKPHYGSWIWKIFYCCGKYSQCTNSMAHVEVNRNKLILNLGDFSTHHFVHTVWAVVCVKYIRIQHSARTPHTIPSMYNKMRR